MTDSALARAQTAAVLRNSLPPDIAERILQVRGAGDAEFWVIGDCAAELCSEASNPAQWLAWRNALADLAGLTPAVVTEHKRAALYYPADVRAEFPTLTRWHFRTALAAGKLEHSYRWLRLAAESSEDWGGGPMPIRVLQAKLGAARWPRTPPLSATLPVYDLDSPTLAALLRQRPAGSRVVVLSGAEWADVAAVQVTVKGEG